MKLSFEKSLFVKYSLKNPIRISFLLTILSILIIGADQLAYKTEKLGASAETPTGSKQHMDTHPTNLIHSTSRNMCLAWLPANLIDEDFLEAKIKSPYLTEDKTILKCLADYVISQITLLWRTLLISK